MNGIESINESTQIHKKRFMLLLKKSNVLSCFPDEILIHFIEYLDLFSIHKILPFPNTITSTNFKIIFCKKNYHYCEYIRYKGGIETYNKYMDELKKIRYIETKNNLYEKFNTKIQNITKKLLILSHSYDKGTYGIRYNIYSQY